MPPLNPRPPCPARCPAWCPARCPSRCQLGRALGQISVDRLSEEQALGMKEQEWAGPEALCPGWQEEEVSDGEGPEDSGHPDPTAHAYEVLQHTLRLEGMPLTIDRTGQPRTGHSSYFRLIKKEWRLSDRLRQRCQSFFEDGQVR